MKRKHIDRAPLATRCVCDFEINDPTECFEQHRNGLDQASMTRIHHAVELATTPADDEVELRFKRSKDPVETLDGDSPYLPSLDQ